MNGAPNHPAAERRLRPVLLVLSHLRWDFVFQRPQQLMTRAAGWYEVLFFEEPVEEDVVAPRLDIFCRGEVLVARPVLPRGLSPEVSVLAQRALLETLLALRAGRALVAWFYSPMFMALAAPVPADVVVYDCMDELSAFRGAPAELLRAASASCWPAPTSSSPAAAASMRRSGAGIRDVHCFPSSVDRGISARRAAACRSRRTRPRMPRPRIGFFGVVDERIDLRLVAELAELRPEWSFVMIGPVVKIDRGKLPRLPNIHWLGGREL